MFRSKSTALMGIQLRRTSVKQETRALALLARIIGRKHGIEVRFSSSASTAYTDGKTITLPLVSNLGNEDHAVLIEGLIDHEAMHCRFTDFDVALRNLEPLVSSLTNLIEDVWGEREQAIIYPGCAKNIRKSMEVMIRLGWYRGPTVGEQYPPAMMLMNYLINGLLARLYGLADLQKFASECRLQLVGIIGEELVARIWETACEVDQVHSTAQAVSLAKEIVNLLKLAKQQAEDKGNANQQSSDQSQQEAESGQSQAQPSKDGAATNEPTKSGGKADSPSGKSEKGQETKSGQGAGGVGQSDQNPPQPSRVEFLQQIVAASKGEISVGDMGERLLAALGNDKKAGIDAVNASHSNFTAGNNASGADPGYPVVGHTLASTEGDRYGAQHLAAINLSRSIAVKLGTKLESVLETKTDSFVLHKRSGRKLEARRAPRIALGKLDVFRRVEEGVEVDTAIALLNDVSGSMQLDFSGVQKVTAVKPEDTRVASAAGAVYAAAQVLDKHDVPFSVTCFGSRHMPIKTFDERWAVARRRAMTHNLSGTATDCAVIRLAEQLVTRQESRKIVLLTTDGQPHNSRGTVVAMKEVRRLGIEFAVLFIGTEGHIFENTLNEAGFTVSRATTKEMLATSLFKAIESAF
jgi:cobaltochelatase CobT